MRTTISIIMDFSKIMGILAPLLDKGLRGKAIKLASASWQLPISRSKAKCLASSRRQKNIHPEFLFLHLPLQLGHPAAERGAATTFNADILADDVEG